MIFFYFFFFPFKCRTSPGRWNRFLHEKREALDAIELLKLFAKHKGMNIDLNHQPHPHILSSDDAVNSLQPSTSTDKLSGVNGESPALDRISDKTETDTLQINSTDIWYSFKQVLYDMCFCDNYHTLHTWKMR